MAKDVGDIANQTNLLALNAAIEAVITSYSIHYTKLYEEKRTEAEKIDGIDNAFLDEQFPLEVGKLREDVDRNNFV